MTLKNKLKELEERYKLISDNMIDAIWAVNAETFKYEYITPSIEKMTGYTPDEYMNFTMDKVLGTESMVKIRELLGRERKKFEEQGISIIHELEVERVNKDGSTSWIEVRARLYREKDGPVKIVGLSRDINERKKYELRKNELIEELGKALVEKEKLLKEVKILRGLLPICSGCKRIRDEHGKWWPMDIYITKRTDTRLTHTMCPDCLEVYYGDL